jgi:hypothetical protein
MVFLPAALPLVDGADFRGDLRRPGCPSGFWLRALILVKL